MKALVDVTQTVEVEIPDGLLTEEFMEEFRKYFYDFFTPADHVQHLAQLHARGVADDYSFIEGYGEAQKVGIKFKILSIATNMDGDGR